MEEFYEKNPQDVDGMDSSDSIEQIGQDKTELLKKLECFFRDAHQYRQNHEREWIECERYYDGKHWENSLDRPVKNFIFSTVEYEVPILTDSRPSPDIVAVDTSPDAEIKKDMLSSSMDYVEGQQDVDIKISQAVRDAIITGNSYLYGDFDPDLSRGDGEVTIENLNWRNVWLDPIANEISKCRYVHIKWATSVSDIARKFKVPVDTVPRISAQSLAQNSNQETDHFDGTRWSPGFGQGDQANRYQGDDITVLDEWWLKDYSMEPIPEEETLAEITKEAQEIIQGINPDISKYEDHVAHIEAHEELRAVAAAEILGIPVEQVTPEIMAELQAQNEEFAIIMLVIDDHVSMHETMLDFNPDAQRPKYPNNLRLILKVGDEIYYDGGNPVEDEDIVPLTPIYCYKKANCIYGFGEVKNLLPIQKSYNDMDWSEFEGLRLVTNPGWVKDDASNVSDDTLTNEPGIVVTKRAGTECMRLPPGQVSPQLAIRKERDANDMQVISGVTESTQGRRPSGITAAQAIKFLQEQSIGRIRLKSRMLEDYSLLRLGKIICNRIIKYWSTERKIRVTDKMTGKARYVEFYPDALKDFEYDLRIIPGSTVGMDKEAIFTIYSDLLAKGVIDPITYFQIVDIPYKNKVLDRLEQQDEMKLAIQQLQQENEALRLEMMKNTPEGQMRLLEMQQEEEQALAEQGIQPDQPAPAQL